MKGLACLVLVAYAILTGCVTETSPPTATCNWPNGATQIPNQAGSSGQESLSADAQAAEDVAIRYADGHSRPGSTVHSMDEYEQTREQCAAALYQLVANIHHVTPQEVRESISRHRNRRLDWAVALSFALLYGLVVNGMARRIWRHYPPREGWLLGVVATLSISAVVSLLGVCFGEIWSLRVEALRIGYGHLSYRTERIPWTQHHMGIFVIGMVGFWVIAWLRRRTAGRRATDQGLRLLNI